MTDLIKKKENFIRHELLVFKDFHPDIVEVFVNYGYHDFLPDDLIEKAYLSDRIQISEGRYAINLLNLARMIELLSVSENDFILNIGVGYGYCAVVLSKMAKAVLATEYDCELLKFFEEKIIQKQLDNIALFKTTKAKGYKDAAPYDAIFINDPIMGKLDDDIISQLSDNGRIVGIEKSGKIFKVFRIKKNRGEVLKEYVFNFI